MDDNPGVQPWVTPDRVNRYLLDAAPAAAFVPDLIAHESHHRGQIGWTPKGTGHPVDGPRPGATASRR